ncbi:MAG TPA: phytanoyl-CoA dioxygenase family protein [Acidimicrobiales bacterium]|nr:phytanoyl-CoA dioxygenase family protein [Acidimicrobiales bacterium]
MTAVLPKLSPGAVAEDVLEALDRDGFAVLEGYLDADEVAAKKADLERVLRSVPTGRNDFEGFASRRIYALFAKTRTFDHQAIDPLVMEVVGALLGPGFQLSAPVGISIGPGETPQNLHRDDSVYPLPRPHRELVVNTIWALDDFTEHNGATILLPGSHRWGDQAPSEYRTLRAVVPAGSMMFFLGSLLHAGGANTTDRPRLGVILEYCAGWVRPQENHVLAVPRHVVAGLARPLQELLGYNVVGLLGNVDGRHPLKYLEDRRPTADGVLVLE